MSFDTIDRCRISGSANLIRVLSLGNMALTGVFPKKRTDKVTSGPVSLVYCPDSGLLQMEQSYDLNEMYGDNYGYRSGLNASMVKHLTDKVAYLQTIKPLDAESTVLDIGGNDGTLLKCYGTAGLRRICIDPTVDKWREHYVGTDIEVEANFFAFRPMNTADIITSIAMFYDLEDPSVFVRDIALSLKPQGIWHFEQSYLPSMLRANAYDTVCHEHLEYYTLSVVMALLAKHGLRVIDVELNDINGGSFAVTAAHIGSGHKENAIAITGLLLKETRTDMLSELRNFEARVSVHRAKLRHLVSDLNNQGHTVAALGASTKGNVLLQYCGFTNRDIGFVSDVNPLKHGCFTPGTHIPIVSEEFARAYKPDYMLVLPWHFREGIVKREQAYLQGGGKLLFPLPNLEVVR